MQTFDKINLHMTKLMDHLFDRFPTEEKIQAYVEPFFGILGKIFGASLISVFMPLLAPLFMSFNMMAVALRNDKLLQQVVDIYHQELPEGVPSVIEFLEAPWTEDFPYDLSNVQVILDTLIVMFKQKLEQ